MMTRPPVRRIVTGHDDQGRAIILSDGAAPNHWSSEMIPGFGATVPWLTAAGPIDHVTDRTRPAADAEIPSFPAPGETILRIADFPPDSVYPDEAGSVIFSEIDGHDEAEAGAEHSGSSTSGSTAPTRWTTPSFSKARSRCWSTKARRPCAPATWRAARHQPRLVQPHRPHGPGVVRADRNRAPVGAQIAEQRRELSQPLESA